MERGDYEGVHVQYSPWLPLPLPPLEQDRGLDQLSHALRRQRDIGLAIQGEVEEQNGEPQNQRLGDFPGLLPFSSLPLLLSLLLPSPPPSSPSYSLPLPPLPSPPFSLLLPTPSLPSPPPSLLLPSPPLPSPLPPTTFSFLPLTPPLPSLSFLSSPPSPSSD